MGHEGLVQGLGQEMSSTTRSYIPVGGVVTEEIGFGLERFIHGPVPLDVLLGTVDYTDEAKLQRVDSPRQDIQGIGAMVHQVNFSKDTDGSPTQGVDMPSQLQSFGVDYVDVGGGDGEYNTVGFGNIF